MTPFHQFLFEEPLQSFADYQRAAKKIALLPADNTLKKLKVAYLSSFTTKGIPEILKVKCLQAGIAADFYAGEYNQYTQEILNPQSTLHAFAPQVIILFVDLQTLIGDSFFRPYEGHASDREKAFTASLEQFQFLIEKLKADFSSRILVHDFEVPCYSPLGILENKQDTGFFESVQDLNNRLRNLYKKDNRVFVFPYDSFCAKRGKDRLADPKMVYMGDMKLDVAHMPALCKDYMAYLKPFAGLSRKCLVLDLDNTLWGGILGEDGFEGIHLGPTPQGRSFWEFQQTILALFQRGVILALNSRNNPQEVLQVLRDHPYMVLREKHFAAMQINWNDKANNLNALAHDLNIGTDSLVFFDDDKANRELVRAALPEVLTVEVPEDPALYAQTLKSLNEFNTLQLTDEDQLRGASYAANRLRENLKKEINMSDYLKGLETVLTVEKAGAFTIPRIAQLTQKTNQFNMTTRRYSESEIKLFSDTPQFSVWSFHLRDKFGDFGIIAVVITEKKDTVLRIDSFLMSCRVLGRRVEDTILVFTQKEAFRMGCHTLQGEFIKTEKNIPAQEFYKNQKFQSRESLSKLKIWDLALAGEPSYPGELKVEVKSS